MGFSIAMLNYHRVTWNYQALPSNDKTCQKNAQYPHALFGFQLRFTTLGWLKPRLAIPLNPGIPWFLPMAIPSMDHDNSPHIYIYCINIYMDTLIINQRSCINSILPLTAKNFMNDGWIAIKLVVDHCSSVNASLSWNIPISLH